MPHESSEAALNELREQLGPPSEVHRQLAAVAGISVASDAPRLVVEASLRVALSRHISSGHAGPPTASQLALLKRLADEAGSPRPDCDTREEVAAWIRAFYLRRREAALRTLDLRRGDLVRIHGARPEEVDEISSISSDGTVWFRGRGRAWPDNIELVARADDDSPATRQLRTVAANRAIARVPTEWTVEKQRELAAYYVPDPAELVEISELSSIIDTAQDERPIQRYLQEHPAILASLLRGPERYVLAQVRLGAQYVADFLLADVDSTGPRWVYVELETPRSPVAMAKRFGFEAHTRSGIQQVEAWREWVQNNLHHARSPGRADGLGLFGIRPRDDALVVVGRRSLLNNADVPRRQLWEESRIRVVTYDWLVEQVSGAVGFSGPSKFNRFLLARPNTTQDE